MVHILQSLLCDNNVQPKGTEIELCDFTVMCSSQWPGREGGRKRQADTETEFNTSIYTY